MFQYYISYAVSFAVFRHHLCNDLIVIVISWLVKNGNCNWKNTANSNSN